MIRVIAKRQMIRIVLPLGLLIGLNSILGSWQENLATQMQQAITTKADWQARQAQLIDDIKTAKDLRRRLRPDASPALYVPVDERAAIKLAEMLAARHNLQQTQFSLSTEAPAPARKLSLVQKRLSLKATAPHDGYALALLDDLSRKLPGKLQPVHLSMTRSTVASDLTNGLMVEAEWLWLMQGTQLAEAAP